MSSALARPLADRPDPHPRWLPVASVGLAALPFVALVWLLRQSAVDVPVWDQWELVPLIEKLQAGSLGWHDLWAQHNEHRLVFPRLIMLLLAQASGWSTNWELAANLVLAAGLLAVLAGQLRQAALAVNDRQWLWWLLPVLALQVFSLRQYENWLWGWQIQIFLNVLCVTVGFAQLARAPFGWRNFVGACLCGVVALYSFANGAAYWLIGGLMIALLPAPSPTRQVALGLWMAVSVVILGSYLAGFHPNSEHPPLSFVLEQPGIYVQYVAAYLGAPLAPFGLADAAWAGLLSVGLFLFLAWRGWRQAPPVRRALAPFVALALYAISSAAITGVGRAGFGAAQALSSRYITLACGLCLANLILLIWLGLPALGGTRRWRWWATPLAAGLVVLMAANSWRSRSSFADHLAYLAPARAALMTLSDDTLLARLYPDLQVLRDRAGYLSTHALSVYRDDDP